MACNTNYSPVARDPVEFRCGVTHALEHCRCKVSVQEERDGLNPFLRLIQGIDVFTLFSATVTTF